MEHYWLIKLKHYCVVIIITMQL